MFISLTLRLTDTFIWYKIVKTQKGSNNISFSHLYSLQSRCPEATTITKDILFIDSKYTWRLEVASTSEVTSSSVAATLFSLDGSTIIYLIPYRKTLKLFQYFIIINNAAITNYIYNFTHL